MKLSNLFESSREMTPEEYILLNVLYGSLHEPKRVEFEKFYHSMAGKPKIAEYYIERKMSDFDRKRFYEDYGSDIKNVSFNGEFIEVESSLGLTIYIYDLAGKPPFKFERNQEVYTFGVFNNCKNLTEFPSWFPNHISQYQQVGTSIKSFKNIHKVIESCGDLYFGKDETIRNVSYIAEIKNLDRVEFSAKPELTKSVNSYLNSTSREDRNAVDLQSHLIDNGFKEYA